MHAGCMYFFLCHKWVVVRLLCELNFFHDTLLFVFADHLHMHYRFPFGAKAVVMYSILTLGTREEGFREVESGRSHNKGEAQPCC